MYDSVITEEERKQQKEEEAKFLLSLSFPTLVNDEKENSQMFVANSPRQTSQQEQYLHADTPSTKRQRTSAGRMSMQLTSSKVADATEAQLQRDLLHSRQMNKNLFKAVEILTRKLEEKKMKKRKRSEMEKGQHQKHQVLCNPPPAPTPPPLMKIKVSC